MGFNIAEKSIIGNREDQQDGYYSCITENIAFAVVCDGMGGSSGGGAASMIAVNRLKKLYEAKNTNETIPSFFLKAIDILDESIVGLQKESLETRGAGTTIVAAAILQNNLYWLSVGDSRLYILRGNEIVQVTRDHNFALSLEQLTNTERQDFLQSQRMHRADALISFIGIGGVKIYDINDTAFPLQPDDKILLTTDGLTKALTDEEILSILQDKPLQESIETLFYTATKKTTGSQDNTTCVLIQIQK